MNYPFWDVPAPGLVIAAIATLHVFISHFAVGGGLFLVLLERKARRENDPALLEYTRGLSRFFVLLTLVLGAVTGVGIWFAIGLVSPAATSSLINTFVWGWAIEWTMFVTEIAAALVYYYGWDRLDARTHLRVGWIYFWSAWLSLVVINGILTFMLTPGRWLETRGFWDGFFNPTFWPAVVARTAAAVALAGIYALFVASRSTDPARKAGVARWAGLRWVVPAAVVLPLALAWFLSAAAGAGVPVGEIFGATGDGLGPVLGALFGAAPGGYPMVRRGALATLFGSLVVVALVLFVALARRERYGRPVTIVVLAAGFVALAGAEWVREGLRKPYVIGGYMFVNGVRLAAPDATRVPDPFTVHMASEGGVLRAAGPWVRVPEGFDPATGAGSVAVLEAAGREVFRAQCAACHSQDGYLAIRPLVKGQSPAALEGVIDKLALPVDAAGKPAEWTDPHVRIRSWRGRRMPPFTGTAGERRALAVYLARLGGASEADVGVPPAATGGAGQALFEQNCAMCHGADGQWPLAGRLKGKDATALYDALGRLSQINDMMADFAGTEAERRALAEFLAAEGRR